MNPKRRFFQIHLSTAVVLMLVAGVLLWANVRELPVSIFNTSDGRIIHRGHGWPFVFKLNYNRDLWFPNLPDDQWYNAMVVYDALIALAILLSVCVACEWLTRRRAARKANEVSEKSQ